MCKFFSQYSCDVARRRQTSHDVARLLLMAPIDPWWNSTPVFGAVAFCATNIKDFRTPLTLTSSTIPLTYSSQKRSLRWNRSKTKIMEIIEVDQLEDTNNERLSWAMPHSGLKIDNKKIKMKNKKCCPPKYVVLPPLPHMYRGRKCRFAPFFPYIIHIT